MQARLQKIISEVGIASRRKAEEMILEGRVTVNGEVAVIGQKADPEMDHIKLDGKLITRGAAPMMYYALHKPPKVMTSLSEAEDRPKVADYLTKLKVRVYPVGRLDFDSEGLLLLMNDGELANRIMHPSRKLPKTYEVKIKGELSDKELDLLRKGIRLEDGWTAPAKISKLRKGKENTWVEVVITEGRKRQIRRMMQAMGHPVIRLIRTKVDGVGLGGLLPGQMRVLQPEEVNKLKAHVGLQ